MLEPLLASAAVTTALLAWACHAHHQWQAKVERERFVLAMKAASTPELLRPKERERLQLLREPWWAVWRWLPEELGHGAARR